MAKTNEKNACVRDLIESYVEGDLKTDSFRLTNLMSECRDSNRNYGVRVLLDLEVVIINM